MLIAVVIVLLVALIVFVVLGGRALLRVLPALLEPRLSALDEQVGRRFSDLETKVDRRLEGIDGRLLSTQKSAGDTATDIAEKLGKLDGTAAQMLARANDLARLEQALRPPKARGGMGELMLANLLRDSLPSDAYQLQYGFKGGERVDAVIKVQQLLPIDAKFPFDNYERLAAAESDEERTMHERAFGRDVKGHVDAIASKYIRPAEGTFDFAFMYLPSESIYYELVCGRTGQLYAYSMSKRIFPVSPSTFHAYMQMILLGLKGLQIEQNAHEVMAYCAQLSTDFERFRGEFDILGRHIGNAESKYAEAARRLGDFEEALERAAEWDEVDELDGDTVVELPSADAA
jgi:DNA recombination protein RmuC